MLQSHDSIGKKSFPQSKCDTSLEIFWRKFIVFSILFWISVSSLACTDFFLSSWEKFRQKVVQKLQNSPQPEALAEEVIREVRDFTGRHPQWKKAGEDFLLFIGAKYFFDSPLFAKVCEEFLEKYPQDRTRASFCCFVLGQFWQKKKDYEKALSYYEKLLKEYPDKKWTKRTTFQKAFLEFRLLRFEECKRTCEKFLERWGKTKLAFQIRRLLSRAEVNLEWRGKKAPLFALLERNEEWVFLKALRGNVVVLVFWIPGQEEKLRPLNRVFRKFEGRNFRLISICELPHKLRELAEIEWRKHMGKLNPNWIHCYSFSGEKRPIRKLYPVPYLPFTLVIDQKGEIVVADFWGELLEEVIDSLLE